MYNSEIIERLRKIQSEIEHDRYTIENIEELIKDIKKDNN